MNEQIDFTIPSISEFIDNFKRGHDKEAITEIFTCGNCFHFALILSQLYPGGKIIYLEMVGHFVYLYENELYDITGSIQANNDLKALDDIKELDKLEYSHLLRDCVYKVDYYPYGKSN